jgi:hypothetical protein
MRSIWPSSSTALHPPSRARCAFSDRDLHSRMPLVPTPARLKLEHACDQWHFSPVSTSYRSNRKFRPNTEGKHDVLERYADVVAASANFMADFARGGRAGNATHYHYELGPPIMNSAEHGDKLGLPAGCGLVLSCSCAPWILSLTIEILPCI